MIRERSDVTREWRRLDEAHLRGGIDWKRWGPYVAERSWGTVREDYGPGGDPRGYFPYDHARLRAYRWSEDGIAGMCDRDQRVCIALALWNGQDSHLKERLFGFPGGTGIRERHEHLDGTPTHSYLRYAYRYPHAAYPYERLREDPACDLAGTGVLEGNRFFDVFVEYAKATHEDLLVRITAVNRGPEEAELHLLPTVWFRNTWAWGREEGPRPFLARACPGAASVRLEESVVGTRFFHAEGDPDLLFTENETNLDRLYGVPNASPFVKDGIGACVVRGEVEAVNPEEYGTKAAFRYRIAPGPREAEVIRLIFCRRPSPRHRDTWFGEAFDATIEEREREADGFYASVIPPNLSPAARSAARRSLADVLWSEQFDHHVVRTWLEGDPGHPPPPPERRDGPLAGWPHLESSGVAVVPDKWESPDPSAWDLAFQAVPLAMIDADLAREQVLRLLGTRSMHPDGRLPASREAIGVTCPPVQAWAALRVFEMEREIRGRGDREFLERAFHALLSNLGWWMNRSDADADATAWTAVLSLDLLAMAIELSRESPAHDDVACSLHERFVTAARMLEARGEETSSALTPLLAVRSVEADDLVRLPGLRRRLGDGPRLLSLVGPDRLPEVLAGVLEREREPSESVLLIEALRRFHAHLGAGFEVEFPVESGARRNLGEVSRAILRQVAASILTGPDGPPRSGGVACVATLLARDGEAPRSAKTVSRRVAGVGVAGEREAVAAGQA